MDFCRKWSEGESVAGTLVVKLVGMVRGRVRARICARRKAVLRSIIVGPGVLIVFWNCERLNWEFGSLVGGGIGRIGFRGYFLAVD